jgi:hypothetical protein
LKRLSENRAGLREQKDFINPRINMNIKKLDKENYEASIEKMKAETELIKAETRLTSSKARLINAEATELERRNNAKK